MAKKPTALGAYIFAGGFTLGVREHFNVLAHFEDDGYGAPTSAAAFPDLPIHVGPETWPWDQYPEVDFLYGNPPCAAWSPLGRRIQGGPDAWKTDARVDCARCHFNLLEVMRPKVWAWESVPQAYTRGRELVNHFTDRAHRIGYDVSYVLHNAQYLGAMQHRKRFFMVCHRINIDWEPKWLDCPSTVKALEKVPRGGDNHEHKAAYPLGLVKEVRPGEAIRGAWERFVEKKEKRLKRKLKKEELPQRAAFGERRCPADRPSGAVIGDAMIHPTEHRYLTIAEMLHLSGFPVDYPLVGNTGDARARQIARGVLPPVGEWLASNVARALRRPSETDGKGRTFEVNFFKPPGEIREIGDDF